MKDSLDKQAARIAGDFLQEKVKTSYPIEGKGITNQVCVVETKIHKVVVRMNGKDEYQSFIKEKWCIEQAAKVGVPGPEVLSIGIVDETAYMIQPFIEGDNGVDSTVPKSTIWRRLGEYAKLIHSIQVKGYGENLIDPVHGEFQSPPHAGSDGTWQGYVQHNINSLTEHDRLIELGVINQMESERIKNRFEDLKSEPFRFGLNHGDISLKNTIVNQANQVILLDWNAKVSVVPHATVAQLMHYQILGLDESPNTEEFQAFMEGYGISGEDLSGIRNYLLLRAFDNLRWAINRRPDLVKPYAAFAKQVVNMIME
ncbi:aminoglycoside phosphotransferase (APT) family kinase protein [Paenibacillus rhizosphaerae]|uniref:Aminoglycoside phosphotransferase (APT) family kinase protein n=1 Tax=Paenibacillus rhizosphaerae TaxID=297318 RepID=A0A839TPG0_9BACL|nr:phosphotransferase [Paenibacillus rhizosphaerae]MBB3128383.1 aminoglycoside phosphotransferase (APT) family kinase protein [Paenibacillus rhizosphaerae]